MRDIAIELQRLVSSGVPFKVMDPTIIAQFSDRLLLSMRSRFDDGVSYHLCPDNSCRTACWIEITCGFEEVLVVELSKVGEYARVYWKSRRSMSADYSTVIPQSHQADYGIALRDVQQVLSSCGITLLTSEELDARVPLSSDKLNPSDEATVGSLAFAFEYH